MRTLLSRSSILSMLAVAGLAVETARAEPPFPIATGGTTEVSMSHAFDGANYLIAIQGDLVAETPTRRFNLEAQRVSPTGAPLGAKIPLGLTDSEPLAAFDGARYLVVSESMDAGGTDGVYGQFVDTLGNPVGARITISHGSGTRNPNALVFGGTSYLLTWEDGRRPGGTPGDHDIYGQRISREGALLGGEFKISGSAGKASLAAFDGTNYLVTWRDDVGDTDILGRLISAAGTFVTSEFPIDANEFPSDNPGALIFDGTRYVAIINDQVSAADDAWDLFGRFVSTAGAVVGDRITIASAAGRQMLPAVAYDGANYLVSWTDQIGTASSNIRFKIFNSAGQPMSSEFTAFSAEGVNYPAISSLSFNGRQFFSCGHRVAFNEEFDITSADLLGTFIAPLPRGSIAIVTDGNDFGTAQATDGVNYLMGIQGGPAAHDEITAQLFSPTGGLIGSRVSTGRFGGFPRVAFDGANYLMIWEDVAQPGSVENLYGQFIGRSGALVRTPFAITTAAGYQTFDSLSHIVFDGSNYLIIWRDERNGHAECDIYGQFVTPAGVLAGAEIPIATEASMQIEPSVCFDGAGFLVAYQNRRAGDRELYDTYGKFISRAGTPGSGFLISQNPSPRHNPIGIASDGANFLVVWNHDTSGGSPNESDWDIRGRVVTRQGLFLGNEFPVAAAAGSEVLFGAVTYDGTAFLASWADLPSGTQRSRFFSRLGAPLANEFSLFGSLGAKIPIGGVVFDGTRPVATACYLDQDFSNGDIYVLPVPAARLTTSLPFPNGRTPLHFSGMPGVTYGIQAATELLPAATVWTTIATGNSLSGAFDISDNDAPQHGRRFYRAVQE